MLGQVEQQWQLFAVYAVFAAGWSAAGLIPATTVVTRWFHLKRSVALSVAWLGALVLCSLAATWRSALWTAEVIRSRRAMPAEGPAISGAATLPASAR